jgi:tRNA pseudouridine38-40 synthase
MGIEYEGSGFFGWQVQRQEPTVQACLEAALAKVADHAVQAICCGRTDTGVHALCQVAHFDTQAQRSERSWILGVNSYLPRGISLLWLRQVDDDFHARFSACARTYRYRIMNRWVRPALAAKHFAWCHQPLDAELMHNAAQALHGEHDFSAFRAASCQARHAVREILDISVVRIENEIRIEVTANGFLYHMVRNIAGSLMAIGRGEKPVTWIRELLLGRDRNLAAATAAAEGLYFVAARYPDQYRLPQAGIDFPAGKGQ